MFNKHDLPYIFGASFLVSLSLIVYLLWIPSPPKFIKEAHQIIFTDEEQQNSTIYNINNYRRISGVILSHDKQNPNRFHWGVGASLTYLTEDEHRTVKEEYISKKRCPAAFYNSHAKPLLLISDDNEVFSKMRSAANRRGKKIELEGNILSLVEMKYKGAAVSFDIANGNFFYVTNLNTF